MTRKLSPRQEAFAAGVARGLTQAEAYRQAYPKAHGWKDKTVWKRSSELAQKGEVSGRIQGLNAKAAAANEVTQARIIRELARIAFSDMRAVTAWGPSGLTLRDSAGLSDDEAAAVLEVSETRTESGGGTRKVKLNDKVRALEMLGKHLGMFTERVEVAATGITWRGEE